MPRNLQLGLIDLLGREDRQIETHSTLQLSVVTGAERRNYHFATAALEFGGLQWRSQLRKTSEIRTSITRAANRATLELQNVDTELGVEFLGIQEFVFGAEAEVGKHWFDEKSNADIHDVFLTGSVSGLEVGEQAVRLTVVADIYSSVSVGPNRTVTRLCQWAEHGDYKGLECGYEGPEPTCNGLLNDAGGCQGRHGTLLKVAKFGGFPYMDNLAKFKII